MIKKNWLLQLYQSPRTVFRLSDVALITGESNAISLVKKLHYQVEKGNLKNPRRGLYTKPIYDPQALACSLYTPSYVSLEYVLQKEGIIFQYDSTITSVSYLTRALEIDGNKLRYSKLKDAILLDTRGIVSYSNGLSVATKERAFLDMIYLYGEVYFDSLNSLSADLVSKILPLYASKTLDKRVEKMLQI